MKKASILKVLLSIFIVNQIQNLSAQTCMPCDINSSWQYSKAIIIDNSTNPIALSNYQVLLNFDTQTPITNGEMNVDGSDIRFTTNCADNVHYFIENGINTVSTAIWIKIPSIAANSMDTIYMIYGNPSALPFSNADSTFDMHDDFNGSSLDLTKWEVRGTPAMSLNAGILTFEGNNNWEYIRSNAQFTQPVIIEETYAQTGPSFGLVLGYTGTDNRYTFREAAPGLIGCTEDPDVSGGNAWFDLNYPSVPNPTSSSQYYTYKVVAGINVNTVEVTEFCNVTTSNCNTTPKMLSMYLGTGFYVGFSSYSAGYIGYIDNIRVRKYSPIVPSISVQNVFLPPVVNLGNDTSFCESGILDAGNTGSTYLWSDLSTNQTLIVTAPGTYSVTITDANTCTSSDNIQITIDPLPIVDLGEDTTICAGASVVLDAQNSGSTYFWNEGSTTQTINASADGIYFVIVTSPSGCENSDTIDINVHIIDNTTNTSSLTITSNAVFATYQWIDCNNSNQPIINEDQMSFTANVNGSYAVIINQIGCVDTSACVSINSVGLNDPLTSISNIFPNPTNGNLYITVKSGGYYQVTNLFGQVVAQVQLFVSETNLIDLTHLDNGIYFIKNVDDANASKKKIVVSR